MRWGRQRRQQQQQQQQEEEEEDKPSSAFSLFRLLPLSWISKLKPTKSKTEPPRSPTPKQRAAAGGAAASRRRPQPRPPPKPETTSKKRLSSPAGHHRAPPPRLSSASDHLSFSPALLDRLVDRSHVEPDNAPRRHSCAGDDEDDGARFPDVRGISRAGRVVESARFNGGLMEPGFPLLSCRSCRADPERSGFYYDLARMGSDVRGPPRIVDVSSETVGSDDDVPERGRLRRGSVDARRKPATARRGIENGPSPTEEKLFPHMKPARRGTNGEPTEKDRRQLATPETTAGDEQRSGRRSFTGRVKQRSRVKVFSPRAAAAAAAAAARVKAAKEKKERRKVEEEEEKRRRRRRRGKSLESFAVVKCSIDPQRDFRESMVEMIEKNGMGSPEEMERLLACYLELNADEYHDVIVRAFRQVWLEINPGRLLLSE